MLHFVQYLDALSLLFCRLELAGVSHFCCEINMTSSGLVEKVGLLFISTSVLEASYV